MATPTFSNFKQSGGNGGVGFDDKIFALTVYNGSATKDPSSLLDGAGETLSFTVTGAALGDYVMVAAPYDLQDITVTGYVQAADTVEVRIQNESGSTVDLASGTWKVKVIHDGI